MFGKQRGQVDLQHVLTVRVIATDKCSFELQSTDFVKRIFKCSSETVCQEWVSAIRSAVKEHSQRQGRRGLSNDQQESKPQDGSDVTVVLVSVRSKATLAERVLCHNPSWQRIIRLVVDLEDKIIISLSNGGQVLLRCLISLCLLSN